MKIFYFAMPFQNLNTYMRMGKIAGLAVWNLLNISPNIFKLPGIDIQSLLLNKLKTLCNKILEGRTF